MVLLALFTVLPTAKAAADPATPHPLPGPEPEAELLPEVRPGQMLPPAMYTPARTVDAMGLSGPRARH